MERPINPVPQELHEEFPDDVERIYNLKLLDGQFAQLANSYQEMNKKIHRMETGIEPAGGDILEKLKKERLAIKEEIAGMLR